MKRVEVFCKGNLTNLKNMVVYKDRMPGNVGRTIFHFIMETSLLSVCLSAVSSAKFITVVEFACQNGFQIK